MIELLSTYTNAIVFFHKPLVIMSDDECGDDHSDDGMIHFRDPFEEYNCAVKELKLLDQSENMLLDEKVRLVNSLILGLDTRDLFEKSSNTAKEPIDVSREDFIAFCDTFQNYSLANKGRFAELVFCGMCDTMIGHLGKDGCKRCAKR